MSKQRSDSEVSAGGKSVSSSNSDDGGIVNPFEYNCPPSAYELGKMTFFFMSGIALVRVIMFIVLMGCCALLSTVATIGLSPRSACEKPLHPIRRLVMLPVPYLTRCVLFTFGVWKIQVIGEPDPRASLVTPNHCSLFDALLVSYFTPIAPVAKAEVFKVPGLRRILMAHQGIPVERETHEGKEFTKNAMRRYVHEAGYPRLLIFPQGTTTRNDALTMFQRGAFLYGKPVQPVVLDYRDNKNHDLSYTCTRQKDYYFRRHFCQFMIHAKVTFLPIHEPSAAEKLDATLFANNVRQRIADTLGPDTQLTDHYFADAKLFRAALKKKEQIHVLDVLEKPKSTDAVHLGNFSLMQLKSVFDGDKRWSVDQVRDLYDVFLNIDTNCDGLLDFEEFCRALQINSEAPDASVLFSFFDRDGSGSLNFKELVLSLAVCSDDNQCTASVLDEKIRLAFDLFDKNKDGVISQSELETMVSSFPIDTATQESSKVQRLLAAASRRNPPLDDNKCPIISFELFKEIIQEDPEVMNSALRTKVRSLYSNSTASSTSDKSGSNTETKKSK